MCAPEYTSHACTHSQTCYLHETIIILSLTGVMRSKGDSAVGGSLVPYTAVIRRNFQTPTGPFVESLMPVVTAIRHFLLREIVIISLLGRLLVLDYIAITQSPQISRTTNILKCLHNSEV